MGIFLMYETALAYWLTRLTPGVVLPAKIVASPPPTAVVSNLLGACVDKMSIERARAFMVAAGAWTAEQAKTRTLHVGVAARSDRGRRKGVRYHCILGQVPVGAFCEVEEGIFVASPAYCLLQLAGTGIPMYALVETAVELCGAYGINPTGDGLAGERVPLCSTETIAAFLDQLKGVRGLARAKRALAWTTDNSLSPMETILLVLLKMPVEEGGHGFAAFEANVSIPVREQSLRALIGGKRSVRGDIVLEGLRAVIEYDSYENHLSKHDFDATQARANVLRAMGWHVISLTYGQVKDCKGFEATMWAIEQQLGLLHHNPSSHERHLQQEAHEFLMTQGRSRF